MCTAQASPRVSSPTIKPWTQAPSDARMMAGTLTATCPTNPTCPIHISATSTQSQSWNPKSCTPVFARKENANETVPVTWPPMTRAFWESAATSASSRRTGCWRQSANCRWKGLTIWTIWSRAHARRRSATRSTAHVTQLGVNAQTYANATSAQTATFTSTSLQNRRNRQRTLTRNTIEKWTCRKAWTSSQFSFLSFDFT